MEPEIREESDNREPRYELLGACKSFPMIHLKPENQDNKERYLVFNVSEKKLSNYPANGFRIERFNGSLSALEKMIGKDKIFEISDKDKCNFGQVESQNKTASSKKGFFYRLFAKKQKALNLQEEEIKIQEERLNSYYFVYVQVS